jgi:hypothetical protein
MMYPSWSLAYIIKPKPHCFRLLRQETARAFARAFERAGRSIEAKIAIIAMTTKSSIRVKDFFIGVFDLEKEKRENQQLSLIIEKNDNFQKL